MVGNDVVDLGDPETRGGPSHPRFDERVFAASERRALEASGAPNRLRWLLWAAKEAAYKLGVKRTPGLVFSPRRFVVELDATLCGRIAYPGGETQVELRSDEDAVHAIAALDAGADVLTGVAHAAGGEDASRAVREFALERIAARLGIGEDGLRLGRRGRIPTLELCASGASLDLSLSHHGRYLAFACDLGELAR